MQNPWILALLVAGVVALTPVADRIKVPQPVLLTLFGVAVGFLPGTAQLSVDPDVILPVVLPPLLFAATQRSTAREFRDHAGAVLTLAVGLTLTTVAVVAVVAHALGVPWAAAWVLGAIVSPPDPVAATAVARRLRLPHRLVTILEGEGMFNDATALVAYKVAVAAAVTGSFAYAEVGLQFVLTVVVGIAVGLAMGVAAKWALGVIHDGYAETTITVAVPFVAYVAAEHLEGSGVLAVLVLGLWLRTFSHEATTAQGWLLGRFVWSYGDFLITSLVFALLGYELVGVARNAQVDAGTLRLAGATVVSVMVFRAVWIYAATFVSRLRAHRRDDPLPSDMREATVVAWAGMRGVVTVAAALALPNTLDTGVAFPMRETLLLTALATVLVTLVVQGLTLAPLTQALGVCSDHDERSETADLQRSTAEAALAYLDSIDADELDLTETSVRDAVRIQYRARLEAQDAMEEAQRLDAYEDDDRSPADEISSLLLRAIDVERTLVLDARRHGRVSAASADEVLRQIEGRSLRDLG